MRKTAATLLFCVMVLISLGLIMLAGVSPVRAASLGGDSYLFLRRQLQWLGVSIVVALFAARFDYHWFQRPWVQALLLVATLLGLIAVFLPVVGIRLYGSARWVRIGGFRMQPSEFAKFSVVVLTAAWMDHLGWRVRRFWPGFAAPATVLSVILILTLLEPDFGATVLIGAFAFGIMLVAGVRLRYLLSFGLIALLVFALLVRLDPVRFGRMRAFVDAEGNRAVSHQLLQSKTALIRGGMLGVGLGNSIQKHLYLPEAHTDFIFAILGEELGFAGTASVVLLFAAIGICGMRLAVRAPDVFGKLLAFGLTLLLGLQAAVNTGVVTGLLPTKGLALPFISYGGSSLLMSMTALGVLLNVSKHIESAGHHAHTRTVQNAVRRF